VAKEDEMTKRLFKLLWPAAVAATLALSSVSAEAGDVRARVPFDFTVKGKALRAGTYDVSATRGVLTLHGENGGAIVLTSRVGSAADHQLRLVFEKYGDAYVLRQAWTGSGGEQVPVSAYDRELAQQARKGNLAAALRIVIPAL
jgi:hypothetical protein